MEEAKMARKALIWSMVMGLALSFIANHVYGEHSLEGQFSGSHYHDQIRKMQAFKDSFTQPSIAPSPSYTQQPQQAAFSARVYHVTSYGADPTGRRDSTEAVLRAISDAVQGSSEGLLMEGIKNLGGAQVNLDGGNYLISLPLRLPATGLGNLMIHGGTLRASDDFATDGFLIDLSASSTSNNNEENGGSSMGAQLSSSSSYNYEYITLKDLMLDSSYKGGGIAVRNSLRTSIDNCYIAHFTSNGILVQGGHETYIRNSFLGQHITAGGDHGEKMFSGTAISLMGNDNAVTDVVIFSAAIGILISGQANIISGVHCYNKATGFGGTGIYLQLPGLTQTRIINSYLDYTGIVAEDPVQLHISNTFFLGDAYIVLKSINGVANGINIVDNMFCGSDKGVDIVQLDQSKRPFKDIKQVVIDRNNVKGMNIKATVARGSVNGVGNSWVVDFNRVLVFPNLISHVQYSLSSTSSQFPNHALRNVSNNRVQIQTSLNVSASVFVTVDQWVAN
ncbi:polygalacturonase QRT3-like isoform X2 [Quercus lobata]|uniref:Rhamnogalacturonase A/B/Epimerase-like pectate lyase domain-containing protein n=1 Tax=Quercus lobata TaxID=97700 RepID=A0A7N2LC67_QUELO|nr:polygalacturonase QRT3-like isoform X2 [Quercus lobata]